MQIKILSVTEVTQYIKRILSNDPILYNLRVKGEVSNCKIHSSGHLYFTLKDQQSRINCVMFRSNCEKLKFQIENGMKVNIRGYISVYERDGQYQLYINEMEPDGLGALYLAYQQLKDKLEKEGLFHSKYKKPIPYLPERIAVITSPTGAAIRDILSVIKRRFNRIEILIFPVLVQGEGARASIVEALNKANLMDNIDVIILGRGGGSIEELWAFNEEDVAKAIFSSNIPVISAVGHETDYTIADFVADLRAPTPSAAAELAVPAKEELKERLSLLNRRLNHLMKGNLQVHRKNLTNLLTAYSFKYPYHRIYDERQRLDFLLGHLHKQENRFIRENRILLKGLGSRLNALSPLAVLERGYSVTTDENGRVLKRIKQISPGDQITVTLSDGSLKCRVMNINKEEPSLEKKKI